MYSLPVSSTAELQNSDLPAGRTVTWSATQAGTGSVPSESFTGKFNSEVAVGPGRQHTVFQLELPVQLEVQFNLKLLPLHPSLQVVQVRLGLGVGVTDITLRLSSLASEVH